MRPTPLAIVGATLLVLCSCWTILVGAAALAAVDGHIAGLVAQHSNRFLDRFASIGSPLFGIVGVGVLATVLGTALLCQRRMYKVAALVLALALSSVAERGLRAWFVQPAATELRTSSLTRAESQAPATVAVTARASVPALGIPDAHHSYPSGHVTLAAALLLVAGIAYARPSTPLRAAYVLMLVALLAWGSWSEIYRGTHLISDTAGGLLLGAGIASLCLAALEPHQQRSPPAPSAGRVESLPSH